ncbi:MAG TPA: PASTA domain-containing protein [Gaiellaceae bacterium]
MAVRLAALLPRAVIVALVWVLATAAFTFAADSTIVGPSSPTTSTTPVQPAELVVPSVVGQAYVFSKGILEDAGFAWHVEGSVHGYSSNRVLTQSPAAGTHVVDTGAPTITLHLSRGPYAQLGEPADSAPYTGTAIRLAGLAAVTKPAVKPKATPKAPAAPKVKPVAKKPAVKPAVKKPAVKPAAKPVQKLAARPPAFAVKGAPKEPLDEITLSARASRLEAWVANKPKTPANVQHWLYQHAWIVTGAKFGWSHGEQALETLIRVDRHVERAWGVGAKSESVARAALTRVRREAK